jgi:hypothetical protein
MVFSSEAIRHLLTQIGANQITYGTDGPTTSSPQSRLETVSTPALFFLV